MKKILFIAILTAVSFLNYACANTKADKKPAQTTDKVGEVVQMTNDMFITKVFDYTKGKEWNYLGQKPAIIDFYADWCGPCRRVAPIMKDIAGEYADQIVVYKVDTDKEKELAGAMGIQSLPTIVFIPLKGQPQIIMGAADKATFKNAVEQVLLGKPKK
ncbi:MAG: thioredoxin domain-containing protein [Bacteroides sp.]